MKNADRIPVIAAIGEFTYRPDRMEDALEPIDLMIEAMKQAEEECKSPILDIIDTVVVPGIVSWLYSNPAKLLCEKLGINPSNTINAGMGGEKPVKHLHDAAIAIQRGDKNAIAIVGGEAQNSFRKARRSKFTLNWTDRASRKDAWGSLGDTILGIDKPVQKLGVQRPIHVYPFFENAFNDQEKKSPLESRSDASKIWSSYSKVAAKNPYSWDQTHYNAKHISAITEFNRMVSFPYSKLMVANDSVNQAAAVIITSLSTARKLGISNKNLIYFKGGAAANAPTDFLKRERFDHYPALESVLTKACEIAGGGQNIDALELYSCFPIVPKAALRVLETQNINQSLAPTVTGGLTFFGGPMNNYMTHATCAMVRTLRRTKNAKGLLYGQGGVMTKHHALILSSEVNTSALDNNYFIQNHVEALSLPPPKLIHDYNGVAEIETYSVYFNSDNEVHQGIIIARTPEKNRLIAKIDIEDEETILALTDFDINAIGLKGDVEKDEDGNLTWSLFCKESKRKC